MSLRVACGMQLASSALLVGGLVVASALFGGCPWGRAAVLVVASATFVALGVALVSTAPLRAAPVSSSAGATAAQALSWSPAAAIALLLYVPSLQRFPAGLAVLLLPVGLPLVALVARGLGSLLPRALRDLLGYFS